MEKLLEALKALLAHGNREEVVQLVEKEGAPIFQGIFQRGFDTGYGKGHGELETATAKVTELQGKVTTVETENAKLKANPDTAALHAQYGQEITKLKGDAEREANTLRGTIADERQTVSMRDLRTHLVDEGDKRLRPVYADVLLQKAEVRTRVKVNADGTRQVLQKGKDIPIAAQTFEAALAIMAGELKAEAPSDFVLAGTDAGGGIGGIGGRSTTTTQPSGSAALAESIRASVKNAPATDAPKPHGAFAALATH